MKDNGKVLQMEDALYCKYSSFPATASLSDASIPRHDRFGDAV